MTLGKGQFRLWQQKRNKKFSSKHKNLVVSSIQRQLFERDPGFFFGREISYGAGAERVSLWTSSQ